MHLTRRGWEVVGIGGVFLSLGALARQPLALYAAVVIAAVVLTRQVAAVQSFSEVNELVTIDYDTSTKATTVDDELQVTLTVSLSTPQSTPMEVTAALPTGATGQGENTRTIRLDPGETAATMTFSCSFPIAGKFRFPEPTVAFEDRRGWFRETFETSNMERPSILIEPRTPRRVHVGQGGEEIAAYGEHETGSTGAGITPEELRQYVPGDPRRRIDWKATARLGEPHVREFEAETDSQTVLVFDHRSAMDVGVAGATMLEYAREVALGLVGVAEHNGNPLGLYAVGDDGLTASEQPTASPQGYQGVRTALYDFTPSGSQNNSRATGQRSSLADGGRTRAKHVRRLAGDTTRFARTLRPYLQARGVERPLDDAPLLETVTRLQAELSGQSWTVLLTSDDDPSQVRQVVDAARQGNDYVSVFLTPQVLFEPAGLADIDQAYQRYVDFEAFRRELARLDSVTAFEVGPGDRLHAVLEQQRS